VRGVRARRLAAPRVTRPRDARLTEPPRAATIVRDGDPLVRPGPVPGRPEDEAPTRVPRLETTVSFTTRTGSMSLVTAAALLGSVLFAQAPTPPQAPAPPQPATKFTRAAVIDAPAVRAASGLDRLLPAQAETIYRALAARFQPARAMATVTFMDRFWRVPTNPGFDASIEHLRAGLIDAGFREGALAGATAPVFAVEEYPNGGNGWELVRAGMTIVGAADGPVPEPVFDPVVDYIALCMNSFSTPAGGVEAPLVYVGDGASAASYESVDVKGAVVLGDGRLGGLWQEAVRARGAIGVITAAPPPGYTRPAETPEVFQWGSVPYDEKLRGFGFKASRKVADRLKARLKAGPVRVKVDIETRFHPGPGRLLVAEIPGRVSPSDRLVMVAHIQEPGSNDNASGCGTLLELARALQAAIAAQAIAPPGRTLTFVWGDEMRASREWLQRDRNRQAGTRYMVSLDMTGEDTTKTGGTYLIEKEPDPSAVWPRPSDPHTEWLGGSESTAKLETLRGSLLNDVLLAAALRRARDTGWVVQTIPYEGGSDHSVFLRAGVPAALATHFTDRYYHTNLDRPDKTSPAVMANVGISVGTAMMLLASARETEALGVADLVADAARRRLALEADQSAAFVAQAADKTAAEAGERVLHDAWIAWYTRALESVLDLPLSGHSDRLEPKVRAAIRQLSARPAR
jgi:aminopeptidase YwaD